MAARARLRTSARRYSISADRSMHEQIDAPAEPVSAALADFAHITVHADWLWLNGGRIECVTIRRLRRATEHHRTVRNRRGRRSLE